MSIVWLNRVMLHSDVKYFPHTVNYQMQKIIRFDKIFSFFL